MTSLQDMQRMVHDAVFETGPDGPALAAISEHIEPSDGFTAAEHLLIYRRAILGTLVRALGAIHPVCKRLVGEEFFDAMGRVYARQTPSESPDLGDYGENFGDFIAGFEPAAELIYLADVARLEWLWHRAFHAPDEDSIDVAALGAVAEADMGNIVFKLPISANLLVSDYPVHRIWQVNQDDWTGDQAVNLDEGRVRLIVWRRGHEMHIDELDAVAWSLLSRINAGQTLGEIGTAEGLDNLDEILPHCVQNGWIAGFALQA
ncbi:MAG: DNA-binding domain-containing protein [Gammaproteobacteria bacterium]|jgi:hypothetical protein|nr:DUF2063 domain-containing protein [Chromatiales bacterium]MDP6674499.1 DNA-binding domain-containing protein [Gammaproteobacteria bacterium]